jgi:hypothetical protein
MAQVVVVALGIQIRDLTDRSVQAFLKANCDRKGPAPPAGQANTWLFPKGAAPAKATHEVRVVYELADLAAALDVKSAWVVYDGHSRYGQGPAFGPDGIAEVPDKTAFPVNPWGVHFRMGYDATDTECVGDLLEHSVLPTEHDLTTVDLKTAFLPHALVTAATKVQAQQARIANHKVNAKDTCGLIGAWRSMDVCEPTRAATKTARGDAPLKGRHYYVHKDKAKPEDFLTAVTVGAKDLDKAKLTCAVLFMGSCSSKVHFHAPLVRRRKAAKSSCAFLLTAEVCYAEHSVLFLKQTLIKKRDPTTKADMKKIVHALNGESGAGLVGVY